MNSILIINAGSSSIKFAVYDADKLSNEPPPPPEVSGEIDRIGLESSTFTFHILGKSQTEKVALSKNTFNSAIEVLVNWLKDEAKFTPPKTIGHRIVHGMQFYKPELITNELLAKLRLIRPFDPEHLPSELDIIEALMKRYPSARQVACFDTAFHHSMPNVAKLLPIPRRYFAQGIQRYGFHGLSYSFLLEELVRLREPSATSGRVILAHLGSGASIAAVKDGKCIDTSMAFTPASGLMMGTRSGDIDPGIEPFLAKSEELSSHKFLQMINHDSGLLGVSETSSDMQDLLKIETEDFRAHEAIEMFCHQAKKWIGGFAAILGGIDCLTFAGGIGENAPLVRARICKGLEFLGLHIDHGSNLKNSEVISLPSSQISVRVIRTNEELMIAKYTIRTSL